MKNYDTSNKKRLDDLQNQINNLGGGGGGGANLALSNLNATAINQNLRPNVTNTRSLGEQAFRWNEIFVNTILDFSDGSILYSDNLDGMILRTQNTDLVDSKTLVLRTGNSNQSNSAEIISRSGNAPQGFSGDNIVRSGNALNEGQRGRVVLDGRFIEFTGKQAKNASDPTDPQDLVTKAWAEANLGGGGGGGGETALVDAIDRTIKGPLPSFRLEEFFANYDIVNDDLDLFDQKNFVRISTAVGQLYEPATDQRVNKISFVVDDQGSGIGGFIKCFIYKINSLNEIAEGIYDYELIGAGHKEFVSVIGPQEVSIFVNGDTRNIILEQGEKYIISASLMSIEGFQVGITNFAFKVDLNPPVAGGLYRSIHCPFFSKDLIAPFNLKMKVEYSASFDSIDNNDNLFQGMFVLFDHLGEIYELTNINGITGELEWQIALDMKVPNANHPVIKVIGGQSTGLELKRSTHPIDSISQLHNFTPLRGKGQNFLVDGVQSINFPRILTENDESLFKTKYYGLPLVINNGFTYNNPIVINTANRIFGFKIPNIINNPDFNVIDITFPIRVSNDFNGTIRGAIMNEASAVITQLVTNFFVQTNELSTEREKLVWVTISAPVNTDITGDRLVAIYATPFTSGSLTFFADEVIGSQGGYEFNAGEVPEDFRNDFSGVNFIAYPRLNILTASLKRENGLMKTTDKFPFSVNYPISSNAVNSKIFENFRQVGCCAKTYDDFGLNMFSYPYPALDGDFQVRDGDTLESVFSKDVIYRFINSRFVRIEKE